MTDLPQVHSGPVHSERWRPHRAGIINIWRYLDEVFGFHHGRLLLRGANGTGKSKALELLLPYLLDANLRAHRLSTFGSDRSMHWNLMGDGYPGATRVGYVWLEFARTTPEGTQHFFTCGARLQASTSTTTVSPTYFTTSQRIQRAQRDYSDLGDPAECAGLELLRGGHPLTRSELGAAIGGAGRVFDSSTEEYRGTLRTTLFNGVPREKYEALVVALLQLRTPKLSEHLDPEELSGLLSRSLPPVDADDVAEIAEGFERLDRHAEQLHALEEEAGAARRLADVARRYARRVLRAAADRLTKSTSAMDSVARRARGSATALADAEDELTGVRAADGELAGEHRDLAARAEGIQLLDAYQEGKQLPTLRADATDARRRAEAVARTAADAARTAGQDAAAAATMRDEAAAATDTARRSGDLAADAAELAGRAALVTQLAGTEDLRRARALLEAGLAARRGDVETMQRALAAYADAVRDHSGAERRLETAREEHAAARSTSRAAEAAHTDAVTVLADELTSWAGQCRLLDLGTLLGLGALPSLPALAELAADEPAVTAAVDAAATTVREDLTARRTRLRADRDAVATQRGEVQADRDAVAAQRDVPPPVPYTRAASREGRAGAPLWRVVAFAEGLPERDRAGIEAALEASGLLDAWIQPDGTLEGEPLDTFADGALGTPAPGGSLRDVLVAEPASPVAADRIERLLAAVAYSGAEAFDHPAALGADGRWRLGLTHGRMAKSEPAYIGVVARERARARRLAELDEQLRALDAQLSELDQALEELERRRAQLAAELAARPSHEPVRAAARAWDQAQAREAARADAVARSVAETEQLGGQVRARDQVARQRAAELSLPATPEGLQDYRDALGAFGTAARGWLDDRASAAGLTERAALVADQADRSATQAQAAATQAHELADTAARLRSRLEAVEASVGVAFQELDAQLRQITDRIDTIETERSTLRSRELDLRERIGGLREQRDADARESAAAVAERDTAGETFRRLATGTLGADTQLDLDVGDGVTSTLAAARVLAQRVSEPFEQRHLRDAQGRLDEAVHEVRERLAGRADLQTEAGDDAMVLTATVDGRSLGAAALHQLLADEHATAAEALTAEERDLFDRTLTGDTRRHVADRIRTADELVRGMNQRLGKVRTVSKVRVQLAWQVDPELPPGTRQARDLLLRDPATLTAEERDALHRFFRERIAEARDTHAAASWEAQLTQVFDYTAWHRFIVTVDLGEGTGPRQVTRKLHGTLSGGEKAIVLHLPLFAALAAHYEAAPHAPRLVLLDEVFVGIDPSNRGQLLDLLRGFDLDAVLTSDHEWCTYAELDGIAIHQLLTDDIDKAVTTARFTWNGTALEQADLPEPTPVPVTAGTLFDS
ncbi:MAG: TIGR02680 family protein [Pseudonocardiaceae bacterium]